MLKAGLAPPDIGGSAVPNAVRLIYSLKISQPCTVQISRCVSQLYEELVPDQTSRASTPKHLWHHQAHQQTIPGHEQRHGDTRGLSRDGTDSRAASQAWALRRWHLRHTADTNTCS
ncbi:uncharacterized protein PAC_04599 [Phialocephala subalpina]|uniref:Uncharacterized protein n=1 Tax=Phialocephala subalpina TaxID=576137 RepID=A0A1L7WPM0_9HELO|nr:uncharacterized protein PAC_04599 [Phialocephala subalpina]